MCLLPVPGTQDDVILRNPGHSTKKRGVITKRPKIDFNIFIDNKTI